MQTCLPSWFPKPLTTMTTLTIKTIMTTTIKPKMTNWTKTDLNESGEGPPAAARHHVSVQAAQSTQCGLVTQLLGSNWSDPQDPRLVWIHYLMLICNALKQTSKIDADSREICLRRSKTHQSISCLRQTEKQGWLSVTQYSLSSELEKDQKGVFIYGSYVFHGVPILSSS